MKLLKTYHNFKQIILESNDLINDRWLSIINYSVNFISTKPNDIVKLINNGADINTKGDYGYSLLIKAATYGFNDIVELLLKQTNININIQNDEGCTALIGAATDGREEIVKLLLSRPEIDVTLESNGWRGFSGNFIDILETLGRYKKYLIDYHLQKKIIENNRPDIILFLLKYNLVDENIKKQNPYLITGIDLNLL